MHGAEGHLPSEIGSLTELKWLEIFYSVLSGGTVPDSISLCVQLEVLILHRSGVIPGLFPVGLRALKSLCRLFK
jgi:hypothetical protein